MLTEKNLRYRILYPIRLLFIIKRERKCFPVKQKLKEFTATKQNFQEMLNSLIYAERKTAYPEIRKHIKEKNFTNKSNI